MAVAEGKRASIRTTKDFMLRVRMDRGTLNRLDEMCEKAGSSRSQLVRNFIDANSGEK